MELREAYLLMKLIKPEGGGATVEALNVTENGTYTPEEGVDGFNPVTVNVGGGGGGASGTVTISTTGIAFVDVLTVEEIGFTPKMFALYLKNPPSETKCVLEYIVVDFGTPYDYWRSRGWSGSGSASLDESGLPWTNTQYTSSARPKLQNGIISVKGSNSYPVIAGEYMWYAL